MSQRYSYARATGSYWPKTRFRRQGIVGSRNIKSRIFFKNASIYLIIFLMFTLGYVWTRVKVIETGYQIGRLEVKQQKLKEENRVLMVEAATLRSPQRLEKKAKHYQLKQPQKGQFYFLK